MTIKNAAIVLGVGVVLLVAWWLLGKAPALPPSLDGETPSTQETPQGDQVYAENTDLYTIEATYPVPTNPKTREGVEAIIAEEVARFKSESVSLINGAEADRIRESKRPYQLIIEYKPYSFSSFTSYEFDIYLDTGGAHPNAFFRTATFDSNGEEVALEDLFINGAAYLPRLSGEAYARVVAELRTRAGGEVTTEMEEGVRLGTAPSPEALQFFYLSNGALHLLFPPYQVAAYAAGSFDIAIPLSELQDLLKPEVR